VSRGRRRIGGPRHRPTYVASDARYDHTVPGTIYRPRPVWQVLLIGAALLIGAMFVVAMIIVIAEGGH
jgi:hypothetical protein